MVCVFSRCWADMGATYTCFELLDVGDITASIGRDRQSYDDHLPSEIDIYQVAMPTAANNRSPSSYGYPVTATRVPVMTARMDTRTACVVV